MAGKKESFGIVDGLLSTLSALIEALETPKAPDSAPTDAPESLTATTKLEQAKHQIIEGVEKYTQENSVFMRDMVNAAFTFEIEQRLTPTAVRAGMDQGAEEYGQQLAASVLDTLRRRIAGR